MSKPNHKLVLIISDGHTHSQIVVPDAILNQVERVSGFDALKLITAHTGLSIPRGSHILRSQYVKEIKPPNLLVRSVAITEGVPLNAEYLFFLLLSTKDSESIAGDLEERWRKIKKRFGARRANVWYWTQVIRSLWPFGLAAVKRVSGLLALLEMWRKMRG